KRLIFISLLIINLPVFAQQGFNTSGSFDIDSHINSILSNLDETATQDYYNLLIHFYDNPVDLNKTNGQDLIQLGLLSNEQIDNILAYKKDTGPFKSIYELQVIEKISANEIRALFPFVTVSKTQSLKQVFSEIGHGKRNYATIGYSRILPLAIGYTDDSYLGSPDRTQVRLRLRNPGHISIGLSAQKDPGENWLSNSKIPSPDYVSGHIYLENQGKIKQMALGDYRLQFGQGLVLGAGFMVGKNAEAVTTVKQSNLGIIPYSSITENNFFRGTGVTLQIHENMDISVFYSNQHLDATPLKDQVINAVSAIRTSGLHRTASELEAKDLLHEQVWGSAFIYNKDNYSTGLLITGTNFDKPVLPSPKDYNQYYFSGNNLLNYSWFGQVESGSFIFFGELAKTYKAGEAINIGAIGSLTKYISTSLLLRSLSKDFHSFYGLTFSERSQIANESGIYWGINLYPLKKLSISAYYDMYKFPWLTLSTAGPSDGQEYLIRINYEFNDLTHGYFQLRKETSESKENIGIVDVNQPRSLLKTIINLDYNLESPFTFRTRLQYNLFTASNEEEGWLFYQDINYKSRNIGVSGRILFFDTDSFSARQYAYEKDMLFSYNTKMFNGKGVSYYLLLKYKPVRNLSVRVKWSYTEYLDQDELGSGNDLIEGNTKTQLNAQVHYTF
ncbi:MAG: helix-hairpin-helix domain-containing protein, partial [Bacteroidota bacterium]